MREPQSQSGSPDQDTDTGLSLLGCRPQSRNAEALFRLPVLLAFPPACAPTRHFLYVAVIHR